ncbi:MAG TPA: hypothetical protein VF756_11315 [Thermoanaerobaculia bacterium]
MTVHSPQTPPPPKKGMSPLAWVGIGCAVIVVLGMIAAGITVAAGGWFLKKQVDRFEENPAMVAAELAVRANPDFEVVESDAEKSTLTIRNKKTGEVMTVSAEDIEKGRLTFKNDKGETASIDVSGGEDGGSIRVTDEKGQESVYQATGGAPQDLPSWVPTYPGGTAQSAFDAKTAEGHSAAFTVTTQDSVQQVLDFYKEKLEAEGFKVEKSSYETDGKMAGGVVIGVTEDQKREVNINVATSEQGTQAMVSFNDKP